MIKYLIMINYIKLHHVVLYRFGYLESKHIRLDSTIA